MLVLFAAVGLVLYVGALKNPFHFDDLHSIRYNPHIRSLENIPSFFTDLHTFSSERAGTMFRPLLLCSYALNYALHGHDVVGYRLFNLVLHILCAWLIWQWVRDLGGGGAMAALAGGLFLLHPLQAEPINYISSRSDILVTFLLLAAVLCFSTAQGVWRWGFLALFAAGLLVKSVAIVLPGLCFLSLRGAWANGSWRVYTGRFAAMSALALGYLGLIVANSFLTSSLAKAPRAFDVNLWTQAKAYIYSIWLFVLPVHLSVDHPFVAAGSPWEAQVIWPVLFLASLLVVCLSMYRHWLGVGGLFFAIALLPYALIPLNIMVSERRLYLAGVGFALVVAWALAQFLRRCRRVAMALGAVVLVVFVTLVWERNDIWSSDVRLWEDAVSKGEAQPRARVNLALAYRRESRWDEAREQLRRTLEIDADFADAWVELGNIEHQFGALPAAEHAYSRAVASRPSLAGGHYNLGNIYLAKGDRTRAVASYLKALALNPNFAMAHNNVGQAYEALGKEREALVQYRTALEIDPEQPQAWFNIAALLERRGDRAEAAQAYLRSYELLLSTADFAENAQYQNYAQRAKENARRLGLVE